MTITIGDHYAIATEASTAPSTTGNGDNSIEKIIKIYPKFYISL